MAKCKIKVKLLVFNVKLKNVRSCEFNGEQLNCKRCEELCISVYSCGNFSMFYRNTFYRGRKRSNKFQ